ncbi:MAG: DUF2635 domain-containing protein [Desulfovibrionaceae bacterium]
MASLFLKPAVAGSVVRDPQDGSRLPDEGAEKPATPYWRRLLYTGDVHVCPPQNPKQSKALSTTNPKE